MSPSGGETMLVDQPITWSPQSRVSSSRSAKQRWFEQWPGVCSTSTDQPLPVTISPSPHPVIGHEIVIATALARAVFGAGAMGAIGIAGRAGGRLHRLHRRGVVGVGVGHQNMTDRLAPNGVEQRIHMLGQVRAGIDDRHLTGTDDVGAGAVKGKSAGLRAITRRISGVI